MKVKFDCLYRPKVLSIGIDIGNNKFKKDWPKNFFIDISILFWTFGVEFLSEEWYDGPYSGTAEKTNRGGTGAR